MQSELSFTNDKPHVLYAVYVRLIEVLSVFEALYSHSTLLNRCIFLSLNPKVKQKQSILYIVNYKAEMYV